MKFIAMFLVCLILLGCSRTEIEADASIKQTRDDKTFTMTMELASPTEVMRTCEKLGVPYDSNGCAAFNLDTKHCTIYVSPQRFPHDEEKLTIIGHEVWHCRFGRWHD